MKKIFIIIAVLIMFSGCMGLSVFYDKMHLYVIGKLDENFNLSAEQKKFLKIKIIKYRSWQKNSELALYKNFVLDVKKYVNEDASLNDAENLQKRMYQLYNRSAMYLMPDIVIFMKQLDANQIEFYLKKRNESDSQKLEFLDYPDKKYNELSHKNQITRLEKYFGKFNKVQILQIEKIFDYDKNLAARLLADDINARNRFAYHVKYQKNDSDFSEWVESLFIYGEILYTSEELSRRKFYNRKQLLRIHEVVRILNPQQRKYFSQKMDGYAAEIDKIMKN